MEDIILVGGGGHCRSVIDVIEQENRYNIIGIIDKEESVGERILGYDIIGSNDNLYELFKVCQNAVVTVGQIRSNDIRVRLFHYLQDIGFVLPVIISPLAYVSKYSIIKEGTVIMHHALINSNVEIGANCIINTKALIEHDVKIGENCHISTGAVINGGVNIKANTFFGSNSVSKESITIEGFIKAGSIVK
jgi:sugar O-acyltransferase (sialic acid O-acetyltransferase NeuD family)